MKLISQLWFSGYNCMVSLSCGKTNQASYGLVTNLEKWLRLIYLGSLNQGGLTSFASGSKWRSQSYYGQGFSSQGKTLVNFGLVSNMNVCRLYVISVGF